MGSEAPAKALRIATAQCGQLLITAGNGRQSIDTVNVTIGGKAPTHVAASASIQAAINATRHAPRPPVWQWPAPPPVRGTLTNAVHSELLLTGARGTAVTVTFTGTNLTGTFAVTGIGALIPVNNLTVVSSTQVTATLNITRAAPLGIRNLGLTTPGGTNNTEPSTVTGDTPAFTGPTPALTTTPANGTTKTGTVTLRNTATGAIAGPITLTAAPVVNRVSGTGAFTVTGGTCASGIATVSGLFFGLAFGLGGIGAALLGELADHTSINFVYHVCSFLPALGILTAFLPDLTAKRKN